MVFIACIISSIGYIPLCYAASSQTHAYTSSQDLLPIPESMVSTVLFYGSDYDNGEDLVIDDDGFIYLVGNTESSDFPVLNAYDDSHNGADDCFLMKIGPDLSTVHYATFIGGSEDEYVQSITLDSNGFIYIIGHTNSPDFPMTINASLSGEDETDAFVMKIDSLSGTPIFSVRLGGSDSEYGEAVGVDNEGNVHIVGSTASEDYPLVDPIDNTLNGSIDCFWATLCSNGTPIFSTYFGGNDHDQAYDLGIGPEGYVYIIGSTGSENFPSALHGNATFSGWSDCFVIKCNKTTHSLVCSTLIGGQKSDIGWTFDIDKEGNVYVGGITNSWDFPIVNGFDSSFGGGDRDGFILKLDSNGESILYSTYVGDYHVDDVIDIAVDQDGFAYLTGFTLSKTFPCEDPLSYDHYGDLWDGFVAKVNKNGSRLEYSTYIGGSDDESGNGMALLSDGSVLITGFTFSDNFVGLDPSSSRFFRKACFLSKINDLTDSDDDKLRNVLEMDIGSDIHQIDSDYDSIGDYWEFVNGYDPLDPDVSVIEFLHFHILWVILIVFLPSISIVLFLGRSRIYASMIIMDMVIKNYKERRISGGPVPHSITIIMTLVTLLAPNAMIPWTISYNYNFQTIVGGAMFAILWVVLPPDAFPSGFLFLNPYYVILGVILGAFNILFGVQVYRFCKKKTSWKRAILSGVLTLAIPFVFVVIFIYPLLANPVYIGPIPIQLIVGLIIVRLLKTEEKETPWIDEIA